MERLSKQLASFIEQFPKDLEQYLLKYDMALLMDAVGALNRAEDLTIKSIQKPSA